MPWGMTATDASATGQSLFQVAGLSASIIEQTLEAAWSIRPAAPAAGPVENINFLPRETDSEGVQQDLEKRFRALAQEWMRDTELSSSISEIIVHPSYQRIIAMGAPAVGLILRELQARPHHWFWALWILTGESPVPSHAHGNVPLMSEAWLEWGKRKGYLG